MTDPVSIDVFYDYVCPYVNAASLWLSEVERQAPDRVSVRWRYFPLEQVNSQEGPDWKLWEQPVTYESRGLPAFQAAVVARQQGDDAFRKMHAALFAARHEQKRDFTSELATELAGEAGLDVSRFERDLANRSLLAAIGTDFEEGRLRHGVFGTPTFVFPEGTAAYLKVLPPPPPEEALAFLDEFLSVVRNQTYVHEIKRPSRP